MGYLDVCAWAEVEESMIVHILWVTSSTGQYTKVIFPIKNETVSLHPKTVPILSRHKPLLLFCISCVLKRMNNCHKILVWPALQRRSHTIPPISKCPEVDLTCKRGLMTIRNPNAHNPNSWRHLRVLGTKAGRWQYLDNWRTLNPHHLREMKIKPDGVRLRDTTKTVNR